MSEITDRKDIIQLVLMLKGVTSRLQRVDGDNELTCEIIKHSKKIIDDKISKHNLNISKFEIKI